MHFLHFTRLFTDRKPLFVPSSKTFTSVFAQITSLAYRGVQRNFA